MDKTFLQSLLKDQIVPAIIEIFKMIVKALSANLSWKISHEGSYIAYNAV
ncbi:MAG: hypothetical protein IJ192_10400 [Clostridia bacterium]|nr:hypothetical protein [Clostridia bacterium]